MIDESKLKKLDIFLLIVFPIIAVIVSLSINASLIVSTLLFFGLPSLWLSYRTQHMIAKTAIFAFIITIPVIVIDYLAHLNKSWNVPLFFHLEFLDKFHLKM
ncbi:hypothetical protein HQ529_00965 [Candidatus Woesearchaeota archaeon]|nr:hypothetical protein [Candidatus Woesearchaeota archaeon]